MGDTSGMHELQEDQSALGVNDVGDTLPWLDLRLGMDARRAHITLAHRRGVGAFRNDQASVGALAVVSRRHIRDHAGGVVRARARHRRHDEAVAKRVAADSGSAEEWVHVDSLIEKGYQHVALIHVRDK